MNTRMLALVENCRKNPGASQEVLIHLHNWAGNRLPNEYLELLAYANGMEGFVGDQAYLIVWPAQEIADLNDSYGFKALAPDLILFGSNGGDAGYAFDLSIQDKRIVEVPFVDLDAQKVLGTNLTEFLQELARS